MIENVPMYILQICGVLDKWSSYRVLMIILFLLLKKDLQWYEYKNKGKVTKFTSKERGDLRTKNLKFSLLQALSGWFENQV
jgi:hypothetical protein